MSSHILKTWGLREPKWINHSHLPLFLYPFPPSLLPHSLTSSFHLPQTAFILVTSTILCLDGSYKDHNHYTHTHTHFHLSKFLVSSIPQTYAAIQFLVAISFLNKRFMNNFQFTKWTLHIQSVLTSFEMNPIKVELLQKEDRTYKNPFCPTTRKVSKKKNKRKISI